jgi:hypothetical protein
MSEIPRRPLSNRVSQGAAAGTVRSVNTRGAARAKPVGAIDQAMALVDKGIDEIRAYLATPEGRELRRRAAQILMFSAPFLFRMKFFRASPVGRILGLVGGAALVVKVAEALRDWEPEILDLGEPEYSGDGG